MKETIKEDMETKACGHLKYNKGVQDLLFAATSFGG